MERRLVHCHIDAAFVAEHEFMDVLEPVYWTANIYDGLDAFEASLRGFTREQRAVLAGFWYQAEVNNGGHVQLFSNSTGVVWKAALEGLALLGASEHLALLDEALTRVGGTLPFDREAREAHLDAFDEGFDDLDRAFYALEHERELTERMLLYMRAHPDAFVFDGVFEKP